MVNESIIAETVAVLSTDHSPWKSLLLQSRSLNVRVRREEVGLGKPFFQRQVIHLTCVGRGINTDNWYAPKKEKWIIFKTQSMAITDIPYFGISQDIQMATAGANNLG